MIIGTGDKYAGDTAWKQWMERCSVARCGAAAAARLRAQISSAMFARLSKFGMGEEDAAGDDPVAFFDSFFMLRGAADAPKPLKAYYASRLAETGVRLADFVCGTLFGSRSGRVHDIIIEWIATLKGWRPHTIRDAEGRRRFVWEGAGDEGVESLEALESAAFNPAELLDAAPMRRAARQALDEVAGKLKIPAARAALLIYIQAQDVAVTTPGVLEALAMGKSRAYSLSAKAMALLRKTLGSVEGGDSAMFARIFIDVCRAAIPGVEVFEGDGVAVKRL